MNEEKEVKEEVQKEETVITDSYTKEIELPSNGYLGGPKKVTIRAMTTAEEKILYSSRDFGFIKKICKACTVKPRGLDTSVLLPQDLMFMLFQIREITFGPTYKQPAVCQYCGMHQEVEVNIANFEYKLLSDNASSELFIDLHISKANVHLKLLSQDEIDNIEREANTLFQEGKLQDVEGNTMVRKIAAMIDSVSDIEFVDFNHKLSYVTKLHMADFNAIRNKLNQVAETFGINNSVVVDCANAGCDGKVEVLGTICPEFFRPTC